MPFYIYSLTATLRCYPWHSFANNRPVGIHKAVVFDYIIQPSLICIIPLSFQIFCRKARLQQV